MGKTLKLAIIYVVLCMTAVYFLLYMTEQKERTNLQRDINLANQQRQQILDLAQKRAKQQAEMLLIQARALSGFEKPNSKTVENETPAVIFLEEENMVGKYVEEMLVSCYASAGVEGPGMPDLETGDASLPVSLNFLETMMRAADPLRSKLAALSDKYAIAILCSNGEKVHLTDGPAPGKNATRLPCQLESSNPESAVSIAVERINKPPAGTQNVTFPGKPIKDSLVLPDQDTPMAVFISNKTDKPVLIKSNKFDYLALDLSEMELREAAGKKGLSTFNTRKNVVCAQPLSDGQICFAQVELPPDPPPLASRALDNNPIGWGIAIGLFMLSFFYLVLTQKWGAEMETEAAPPRVVPRASPVPPSSIPIMPPASKSEEEEARILLSRLERKHQVRITPSKTNLDLGDVHQSGNNKSAMLRELSRRSAMKDTNA